MSALSIQAISAHLTRPPCAGGAFATLLLALAPPAAAMAGAPTITDLGTLPGGIMSLAGGMNALGQIAGTADTNSGADFRAFLWDPATGMQNLGTLGGESRGHAVSAAGQVVGAARNAQGRRHAFLWEAASGMSDLATLPGGSVSAAYGVNGSGQVVGESSVAGMQDLGTLPGGASSEAYAINDQGHVMGQATTAAGEERAVRWQLDRAPAPVPGVPGRMHGHGYIESDGRHHHFEFHAGVNAAGEPSGRLRYHVGGRRNGAGPEPVPAAAGPRGGRFVAGAITAATVSDDPAVVPGRRPGPMADTAVLEGTGSWNGAPGYLFEARATDAGEPGRGRDTFAITITAPDGTVVAPVCGRLGGGNMQARPPAP